MADRALDAQVFNYLVPFIGGHEGRVLKAYRDPVHVITIGYGFTWGSRVFRQWYESHRGPGKLKMGDTMTEQEAYEVLLLVIKTEYLPPVEKKFAGKRDTIIAPATSMTFNCGNGALDWSWANLIAAGQLKEGISRWRTTGTTAAGKKLPGLVRRRNEEADVAATGRWPAWVKPTSAIGEAPQTHVSQQDIAQAQKWLEVLGYSPGPADGVPGNRTNAAVMRFQQDHGQLEVDGIVGPATLSALQRAIDLRNKGGATVGGTTGSVVVGAGEGTTGAGDAIQTPVGDLGWVGDLLLWGGLAVGVAVLVYFVWRYKDEVNNVLRRLA